jgi:hypothetical protein
MRPKSSPTPSGPGTSVWLRHCPKCKPSRVMNIKTIRPAIAPMILTRISPALAGWEWPRYVCDDSQHVDKVVIEIKAK